MNAAPEAAVLPLSITPSLHCLCKSEKSNRVNGGRRLILQGKSVDKFYLFLPISKGPHVQYGFFLPVKGIHFSCLLWSLTHVCSQSCCSCPNYSKLALFEGRQMATLSRNDISCSNAFHCNLSSSSNPLSGSISAEGTTVASSAISRNALSAEIVYSLRT